MSVALGIQHAVRVRHVAVCGQHRYTIFSHIISQGARFSGKKNVIEHKMRVLIFSSNFI